MFYKLFLTLVIVCLSPTVTVAYHSIKLCNELISKKICYLDQEYSKKCVSKPKTLIDYDLKQQINLIYKLSPPAIKEKICEIEHIFIVKNVDKSWPLAKYKNQSIYLYVKSINKTQISYEDTINRRFSAYMIKYIKNKDNKYIKRGFKVSDADLLQFKIKHNLKIKSKLNYSLLRVIIHELSHFVEDNKEYNKLSPLNIFRCYERKRFDQQTKNSVFDSYNELTKHMRYEVQDSQLLIDLFNSPFSTFYALKSPKEDFAEMMTEYIMLKHFGINHQTMKGDKVLFDRIEQFTHKNIQSKLNIIKTMLNLHNMSDVEKEKFKQDQLHCRGDFKQN